MIAAKEHRESKESLPKENEKDEREFAAKEHRESKEISPKENEREGRKITKKI